MFKRFLALSLLIVSFSAHAEVTIDPSLTLIYPHLTLAAEKKMKEVVASFAPFISRSNLVFRKSILGIDRWSYQIVFTSYQQADPCFDFVKKSIDLKNYQHAAFGLRLLISSIGEETLPYDDAKFEAYKKTLLSLVPTCGSLPFGPKDLDLTYVAEYIIEYIIEKQQNPELAKNFARQIIEQANLAIDDDFLFRMLHIFGKINQIQGTLVDGLNYVQDILTRKAINPTMNEIFFTSLAGILVSFGYYIDVMDPNLVIAKCCPIIDLLFTHTFTALATYAHQHEKETLAYIDSVLLAFPKFKYEDNHEEIIKWQLLRKNGIEAIIAEAQKRLAGDIVLLSKAIDVYMKPDQAKAFLNDINAKLIAQGFPAIAATIYSSAKK